MSIVETVPAREPGYHVWSWWWFAATIGTGTPTSKRHGSGWHLPNRVHPNALRVWDSNQIFSNYIICRVLCFRLLLDCLNEWLIWLLFASQQWVFPTDLFPCISYALVFLFTVCIHARLTSMWFIFLGPWWRIYCLDIFIPQKISVQKLWGSWDTLWASLRMKLMRYLLHSFHPLCCLMSSVSRTLCQLYELNVL